MKKISVSLLAILLLLLTACGKTPVPPQEADAPETPSKKSADSDVDVDLTVLSSTMVYSEIYNMVCSPEDYIGKSVKITGLFSVYDYKGVRYFSCVVPDATACCSQGLEFDPPAELSYPEDYPAPGSQITVTGIFDSYEEQEANGTVLYLVLRDAQLL